MKQILHLLWDGHQGGAQHYVNKVCDSSDWKNYLHNILLFTEEDSVINKRNYPLPASAMKLNSNTETRKYLRALTEYIKQQKIELLHYHYDTLLFLNQIKLFNKCKLIYTEFRDSFMRKTRQALCRFLWRCNGKCWDEIFQNSAFTQRAFGNQLPFLEGKTSIIYNPLLESPSQGKHQLNHLLNNGTLGRLEPVKNNDLFIKPVALCNQNKLNVHFHILSDGTPKKELMDLSQNLDLTNKIIFHGFTHKPLKAMGKQDRLIVPSPEESFGLVALEAVSVGTSVAVFSGTDISDFLIDRKNGNLAKPGNYAGLAKAIKKIVESKVKWQELSVFSRRSTLKNYSLKSHIEKLEKTYDAAFSTEHQKSIA